MLDMILQLAPNLVYVLLIVLAYFLFLAGFVIAYLFPIFGGAAATNDEIPRMGLMVGERLALVPLTLLVALWTGREILLVLQWLLCPC
jgi:hypothetical protein